MSATGDAGRRIPAETVTGSGGSGTRPIVLLLSG
ncbi:MAG: hypothetical protein QOI99_1438, partial [Actinomycetota bacterium]|nr:hypothetical protein [Actinomycetota bacterium]